MTTKNVIIKSAVLLLTSIVTLNSCDQNHSNEFYNIDRSDIAGYEAFIRKYPSSSYVDDARERIETEKENQRIREEIEKENQRIREEAEKERARQEQLERQYGSNWLSTGSEPYARWYGSNQVYDDYTDHSEIRVSAPSNSDVIVIVRQNNQNGRVAGHKYIRAGHTSTIYLQNGKNYQTFFYYGKGWYPAKEMNGGIKGGFIKDEAFSKDGTPTYLYNNVLEYSLTLQQNGNFSTSASSAGEIF